MGVCLFACCFGLKNKCLTCCFEGRMTNGQLNKREKCSLPSYLLPPGTVLPHLVMFAPTASPAQSNPLLWTRCTSADKSQLNTTYTNATVQIVQDTVSNAPFPQRGVISNSRSLSAAEGRSHVLSVTATDCGGEGRKRMLVKPEEQIECEQRENHDQNQRS